MKTLKTLALIITLALGLKSAQAHNLTIGQVTATTFVVDSDLSWLGGNDTEAKLTPFGLITASGFVDSNGWTHNTFGRDGHSLTVSHHLNSILPMIDGQLVWPGDTRLTWQYIIPKGRTYGFWRYTIRF